MFPAEAGTRTSTAAPDRSVERGLSSTAMPASSVMRSVEAPIFNVVALVVRFQMSEDGRPGRFYARRRVTECAGDATLFFRPVWGAVVSIKAVLMVFDYVVGVLQKM